MCEDVPEASPRHPLQRKQKGRGSNERCQQDRQPSASWGKVSPGRLALPTARGAASSEKLSKQWQAGWPHKAALRWGDVPEHQAQLCPFFFSCLLDQWVLDFTMQNRSLGAITLPPMVRADSPVGKGFFIANGDSNSLQKEFTLHWKRIGEASLLF